MMLSQLVPSAINIGKSISQGAKASQLAKTERPEYEIPDAIKEMVSQARYIGGMKELPGQNIMEGRLGEATSKGIAEMRNVAASPADLASNIAKLYGSNMQGMQDIGMAAGQQWLTNQGQLRNALGVLGNEQKTEFDINKMQPYMNAKAAEAALREGAFRNLSSAGTNLASMGSGYANYDMQKQILDKLLAGNNTSTNNTGQPGDMTMTQAVGGTGGYQTSNPSYDPALLEALRGVFSGKTGNQSFETGGFQ